MLCCVAVNCSNRSEKGWKLFRFPVSDRRVKWVQNIRRGNNWTPTEASRLCEKHFENSQFERHRSDGLRKLKPNAIPTLFDVPNPPPMIDPSPRKSLYKNPEKNAAFANSEAARLAKPEQEVNFEN
ncbi:peroxynitrite isomerase THAP4-like [Monomorium pharaonis]|uniref:peroxynitrite isomerase THAP4-like n=1 Tax=Monomorium pharaonis TaxID=307658 RepID=UPI001746422E|nr:peroxynitrite isomerase THAP4-like [Monomorium pharaonis]